MPVDWLEVEVVTDPDGVWSLVTTSTPDEVGKYDLVMWLPDEVVEDTEYGERGAMVDGVTVDVKTFPPVVTVLSYETISPDESVPVSF